MESQQYSSTLKKMVPEGFRQPQVSRTRSPNSVEYLTSLPIETMHSRRPSPVTGPCCSGVRRSPVMCGNRTGEMFYILMAV